MERAGGSGRESAGATGPGAAGEGEGPSANCPRGPQRLQPGEHPGLTAITSSRSAGRTGRRPRAGITMNLLSGWRSISRQKELFRCAVQLHGSTEEAGHWVLPPGKSMHVRGRALDVGPPGAAHWLDTYGYP